MNYEVMVIVAVGLHVNEVYRKLSGKNIYYNDQLDNPTLRLKLGCPRLVSDSQSVVASITSLIGKYFDADITFADVLVDVLADGLHDELFDGLHELLADEPNKESESPINLGSFKIDISNPSNEEETYKTSLVEI